MIIQKYIKVTKGIPMNNFEHKLHKFSIPLLLCISRDEEHVILGTDSLQTNGFFEKFETLL